MSKAMLSRPPMAGRFRFVPFLLLTGLVTLLVVVTLRSPARAVPDHLNAFNQKYGTAGSRLDGCTTCHTGTPDADHLNDYALAFRDADHDFAAIEPLDSDGDGSTNIDEINARTFPGDPNDHPAPPATQEPAPAPSPTPPPTAEPGPAPAPSPQAPEAAQSPEGTSAAPDGLPRTGVGVVALVPVAFVFLGLGRLALSIRRRARPFDW